MGVENQRTEDIKDAGRESWITVSVGCWNSRFFKVALMVVACIVIKHEDSSHRWLHYN
jgi:hypothetical protein